MHDVHSLPNDKSHPARIRSSHHPQLGFELAAREFAKVVLGATQVLNCSVFWEKREEIPGIAVGALIVNPPNAFQSAMEEELPLFQEMFGLSPKLQVARVYPLTTPRKPKVDLPTMTGRPSKDAPLEPQDFDEWVNSNPDKEEKDLLAAMGKLVEPQPFEDTPEGPHLFKGTQARYVLGAEKKRKWGRYISEQIGQGQIPKVRNTIKVPRDTVPVPTTTSAPLSRFRKAS